MFADTRAFSGFSVDDIERAKEFYGDVLGLDVTEEEGLLGLHIADGGDIMVYPKDDHVPATFTILNFPVDDIDEAADELADKGISLVRYEQFDQDDKGIMRGEGGPIGWFEDPAGNVLSILEMS
jgi:predicted enzyme related to lactoylglutathione lyase